MMRRASLALLGLVMGCGQLPALPDEAAERLPASLSSTARPSPSDLRVQGQPCSPTPF